MTWTLEERRKRRSTDRYIALRYQLEHTRAKAALEAVVLADDSGLLVASSGDEEVCNELGAVAPLMGKSPLGLPMPALLRGADVGLRRVEVHGVPLFLATVGGNVARDAHLAMSKDGVERILTWN